MCNSFISIVSLCSALLIWYVKFSFVASTVSIFLFIKYMLSLRTPDALWQSLMTVSWDSLGKDLTELTSDLGAA